MVLPGYEHAYVLEVKNGKISLVLDDYHKESTVQRSLYINDYLYIFSTSEIHVYNQNTWKLVNEISIPQPYYPPRR
jgi:inhibitor of cysteine peptidase